MKILSVFLILLLAIPSFAKEITLIFPDPEQEYTYWFATPEEAQAPAEHTQVGKGKAQVDLPEGDAISLYVLEGSGLKFAQYPLNSLQKETSLKILISDFIGIHMLAVTIEHDGKAVSAGQLTVKSGVEKREILLTPEDRGQIFLYNLPVDQVTLSFEYKSEGEQKQLEPHLYPIDIEKDKVPHISLDVSDPVDTTGPSAEPRSGEVVTPSETVEPPKPSLGKTIFSYFIGIVLLGGLGYGAWWYYKNNQTKVDDVLKKAGVNPADDPLPPAQPVQDKPLEKIVLAGGDLAQPVAASASSTATPEPKLRDSTGQVLMLSEGSTSIGRESADITLTGESSVSRQHAILERKGEHVTIRDEGSTNGTYVNGVRIEGTVHLDPGDQVQLGAVRLTYEE